MALSFSMTKIAFLISPKTQKITYGGFKNLNLSWLGLLTEFSETEMTLYGK